MILFDSAQSLRAIYLSCPTELDILIKAETSSLGGVRASQIRRKLQLNQRSTFDLLPPQRTSRLKS